MVQGTVVVVIVRAACNVDFWTMGLDLLKRFLKLCAQIVRIAKQYVKVKKRELEVRRLEFDRAMKKTTENQLTQTDDEIFRCTKVNVDKVTQTE